MPAPARIYEMAVLIQEKRDSVGNLLEAGDASFFAEGGDRGDTGGEAVNGGWIVTFIGPAGEESRNVEARNKEGAKRVLREQVPTAHIVHVVAAS